MPAAFTELVASHGHHGEPLLLLLLPPPPPPLAARTVSTEASVW